MRLLSAVLDLLYPPRCVFCRRIMRSSAERVCPDCARTLPYAGARGERHGDFFSVCRAPLLYEGTVRESLLRYKFQECPGYAAPYGEMLAVCIRTELDGSWDLITWVPLSRRRLRERGYDQARLLAEETAKRLGTEAVRTLEKPVNTARQSATGSREKRAANISGAYRVPDPALVAGRRILLIDDIVTTGATLSEAARTLRTAGAAEVVCAALATSPD